MQSLGHWPRSLSSWPFVGSSMVHESAAAFERMGARVTTRIYPGMGHLVNDDETRFARELLVGL